MADSDILGGAHLGLVDGEVEGYDTIAAVGGGSGIGICASCRIGLTIPSV